MITELITLTAGQVKAVTVNYTTSGTVSYVSNDRGDATIAGSMGYQLVASAEPVSDVERVYLGVAANSFSGPTDILLDGEIPSATKSGSWV